MTSGMNDVRYLLGIDGGGTGSRARLTDRSGRILAAATAGPANMHIDVVAAWASIMTVSERAMIGAGLNRDALSRTVAGIGVAGIGQRRDRARAWSLAHPFHARTLATDAETACLGAHAGSDGGIVIAGTGSIAVARLNGALHRFGGWGFPGSDLGSGAWIGLEATRLTFLAHDRMAEPSRLSQLVLERFDGDAEDITAFQHGATPRDFASLAPLVAKAASEGDGAALFILRQAGGHIAAMIDRLGALGATRLSLVGGLGPILGGYLPDTTRALLKDPLGDAIDGALLLSRALIPEDGAPR